MHHGSGQVDNDVLAAGRILATVRTGRVRRRSASTESDSPHERRTCRRADTLLVFDPPQKVPNLVLNAILEEWLVPCLMEQFLRERGITRDSLSARYPSLKQGCGRQQPD